MAPGWRLQARRACDRESLAGGPFATRYADPLKRACSRNSRVSRSRNPLHTSGRDANAYGCSGMNRSAHRSYVALFNHLMADEERPERTRR